MDGVKVTFELPAELVERAKAVGIDVENRPDLLIDGLEKAIQKYEAIQRLDEIRTKLDALPPEMQLTQDEIAAELRAFSSELQSLPAEMKPSPEDIAAEIRAY